MRRGQWEPIESAERKRAEREIKRLKENNDRIIASTAHGLMVLASNLEVAFANPTFYQMSGLKRAAVEGRRIAETPHLEGLAELASSAIGPREMPAVRELIYANPRTGRRWFVGSALPLHRDEEAVLLTFADVTEQRQAQEKVREASRLLSLGELVAGVAHELNNPLTAVLGYTQLLEAQDLDASAKEYVRQILTQTQRAIRVVQNLLSFARKHDPERMYLNLATTVERVLTIKAYDLSVSNIEVETVFDPALFMSWPISIGGRRCSSTSWQCATGHDRGAPRKALLIRGSKHVPSGAEGSDDFIRISFTDSGHGIAFEDQKRIFDPFFTTKGAGSGTGLGLSICRTLVQEQGGRIWVESEVGKGATFHVELPVSKPR